MANRYLKPPDMQIEKVEQKIDNFLDPSKQRAHMLLFVVSATLTVIHSATSTFNVPDNSVTLTTVRMLRLEEISGRTAVTTKDEILARWKCNATSNTTIDPWGPDSMCRCVRREPCSGAGCGDELERSCYKKVAPVVANVFAGYDVGYLNVIIAFFLIHIAVLINMTIEMKRSQLDEDPQESSEKYSTIQSPPAKIPDEHVTPQMPTNDDEHPGRKTVKPLDGYDPNNPYSAKQYGRSMVPLRSFPVITATEDRSPLLQANGQKRVPLPAVLDKYVKPDGVLEKILTRESLYLIVLIALSVTCAVLSIVLQAKKDGMGNKNGQSCDVVKNMRNSCMTQTMLACMTFFVSFVDCIAIAAEFYTTYFKKAWHKPTRLFLAGVLEDANNIIAFMLLTATFAGLSGVHDDVTLLFDVLVVLFLGFLQSVQHHLMVQRECVIAYCHALTEQRVTYTDHLGRVVQVEKQVLGYFLNTRLFIFLIMLFSGVVFLQRIEPSILSKDTSATWHYHMRNVALIVAVLPGVLSDVTYEVTHATNMHAHGSHTPYSGPSFWRRSLYLGYMIVFILLSWKTYSVDDRVT